MDGRCPMTIAHFGSGELIKQRSGRQHALHQSLIEPENGTLKYLLYVPRCAL